ncbi:PAS domain S-box protein [Sphingomonas faeni]|uniref:PAS domain S-box protein n=1 Tax=Sphingomonas faeni TaxID=185950 RepID=UPI0020BE134A|nr:PAS domain S-box protein [Sphingomonas faeni]
MEHEGTLNPDQSHEQRGVLLQLSDRLRALQSPEEIIATVSETLGRALRAGQVGYAEVDHSGEYVRIEREWNDGSIPSNARDHRLDEFGPEFISDLRRGDTIVIDDVRGDPRTSSSEALATFEKASIRGFLNVPLVKEGRLSAVLAVHCRTPVKWTLEDVRFAEDVAERTWTELFRVRAELALRDSEAKYRELYLAAERKAAELEAVLESMSDGVYIGSSEGITLANQVALDQLGFSSREELNRNVAVLAEEVETRDAETGIVIPADEQAFTRAFHGQKVVQDVAVRHRLTGEQRIVRCSAAPVVIDGEVIAAVAVNTDVTDARHTEQALRDLNATLEHRVAERNRLFEMTHDLFGVATFEGYLQTINPAWASVLGRSHEELISRPFADIIHSDDLPTTADVIERLMRGEPVHQFLVRLLKADGAPISFAWSAVPDTVPESGIFYTVGRDVTEEQQIEEMLRQSQKMEAVGQLTGGLAHDFNNLLTGMMGNLELLQMRVSRGRTDDLERFVSAAQGAGRRAASLTQRLLAFSRRQTLDPRPTDVSRLIGDMKELLRRTVGPETSIEVVEAPDLWPALIDGTQLESALLNLCINARDAMPEGGRITIEAANKRVDDRAALQYDIDPGEYLQVCVTDAGTGMDAQVIARAFEPFYTTKPIGQGTGLGLSMVYGFARQSGGQVRIDSEVGLGTTICIYLPRCDGDADVVAGGDEASTPIAGGSETILVVDDEATIRHLIDEVLDERGYTVIGVGDGAAGIKVLQSGARIDLLITDVGLPNGMNGRQVADAARVMRPGLKVLFITGYAENVAVGNGHLEPGMELLTKPFTIEALSLKVAEILRARPAKM